MRSAIGRPGVSTDTCDGSFKGGKRASTPNAKNGIRSWGGLFRWLSTAPEGDIVVLQDYPSAEISEPIYRIGEKLKLVAQ